MRTLLSLLVMVGVMWGLATPAGGHPLQADKSVAEQTLNAGAWIPEDRIFVDITGKLTGIRTGGKVIAIWPPRNVHWLLNVNGRVFPLDLGGSAELWGQAEALAGQDVEITGHLDGDRVIVTSIQSAKDPKPAVRVTVTGTLTKLPHHPLLDIGIQPDPFIPCPIPEIPVWRVVANGGHFDLVFAPPDLADKAEELKGAKVVVTGTLEGNVITVTFLRDATMR